MSGNFPVNVDELLKLGRVSTRDDLDGDKRKSKKDTEVSLLHREACLKLPVCR